ncbi:hypothetical protein BD560DRAFT_422523 [Blakeslea trispora]|nr:hypothetical protein BD560DRAFT_422523 [Blakeslea trispora]
MCIIHFLFRLLITLSVTILKYIYIFLITRCNFTNAIFKEVANHIYYFLSFSFKQPLPRVTLFPRWPTILQAQRWKFATLIGRFLKMFQIFFLFAYIKIADILQKKRLTFLGLFTINLGSSSLYHTVTHLTITKQTMQFLNTPPLNHLKKINNYTFFQIISDGDAYINMRILLVASNIKQSPIIFEACMKTLSFLIESTKTSGLHLQLVITVFYYFNSVKTILSLSKQQYLAEFTSDLLEINPMNDKMELRVYSKKDVIIVNIISGEKINSSYISKALWMIKGSLKGIMFFERHSDSSFSPISISKLLKLFVYTVDLPSLKVDFQCSRPTVLKRDYQTFHPYLVRVIS